MSLPYHTDGYAPQQAPLNITDLIPATAVTCCQYAQNQQFTEERYSTLATTAAAPTNLPPTEYHRTDLFLRKSHNADVLSLSVVDMHQNHHQQHQYQYQHYSLSQQPQHWAPTPADLRAENHLHLPEPIESFHGPETSRVTEVPATTEWIAYHPPPPPATTNQHFEITPTVTTQAHHHDQMQHHLQPMQHHLHNIETCHRYPPSIQEHLDINLHEPNQVFGAAESAEPVTLAQTITVTVPEEVPSIHPPNAHFTVQGNMPLVQVGSPGSVSSSESSQPRRGRGIKSGESKAKKHYVCPECSRVFTRPHNLKSHRKTHSDERPFKCEICDLEFRRNHDLKRHMRLHTQEKPYECKVCGERFSRSDALRRHEKVDPRCPGSAISLATRNATGFPDAPDSTLRSSSEPSTRIALEPTDTRVLPIGPAQHVSAAVNHLDRVAPTVHGPSVLRPPQPDNYGAPVHLPPLRYPNEPLVQGTSADMQQQRMR